MDTSTKLRLSDWAYAPDPRDLPPGYVLLDESDARSGYQGYAIGRPDPHRAGRFAEIVLVNRGSDITTAAAQRNPGETVRDLGADTALLADPATRSRHLDDAVAFYRDVERVYGARSATPIQLTGHSLGGACAYVQFASAVTDGRARMPSVESFAAPNPAAYIAAQFPDAPRAAFADCINHVRINDLLCGPRAAPFMFLPRSAHALDSIQPVEFVRGMPQLGINHVLPSDPAARWRMHDTPSLARAFPPGERWLAKDGQLHVTREAAPPALLQSSVASR